MRQSIERIGLAVVVVICVLHTASAIKCWSCRSDFDPRCGDPFDNNTLVITDCAKEPDLDQYPGVRPTMCRKIRQKVHGEWRYFRSCAYMGEPGIGGDERFCLMRTGTYNIFMEYCTCNSKDGCNSAGFIDLNKVLVWFTVIVASALASMLKR